MSFNDNNSIVHLDLSPILYTRARVISSNMELLKKTSMDDEERNNAYYQLTSEIKSIENKFNCQIAIYQDGFRENIWRRDIFNGYKMHRNYKKKSDKQKDILYDIARKGMFEVLPDFLESCKLNGHIPVKMDRLEADDLIYLGVKRFYNDKNNFVIHDDGDMLQLKEYFPNVRLFNTKLAEHDYEFITEKINKKLVSGDNKDNVSNIASINGVTKHFIEYLDEFLVKKGIEKSKEDLENWFLHKVNENKQHQIFKKYFNEFNKNPLRKKNKKQSKKEIFSLSRDELDNYIKENYKDWMYQNYLRNKKLILLENIPEKYEEEFNKIDFNITNDDLDIFAGHLY